VISVSVKKKTTDGGLSILNSSDGNVNLYVNNVLNTNWSSITCDDTTTLSIKAKPSIDAAEIEFDHEIIQVLIEPTSRFTLDLSDDYIGLPADSTGKITEQPTERQIICRIYDGKDLIEDPGNQYSVSCIETTNGLNITGSELIYTWSLPSGGL
jgi:hypothetical protein